MQPRTYGLVLVTVATVMWSSAGLFVRMLDLDMWTTLGWRSVFGGLTLVIISLFGQRTKVPTAVTPYGMYALLGLFSALSMFGYIASLKLTTVANVLSIYATVPFIAAGLAYLLIGERIERRVLTASCVAFVGVLVVAGFALRLTDLAGNALALLMTVSHLQHPAGDGAKTHVAAIGAGERNRLRPVRAALPAADVTRATKRWRACDPRGIRIDDLGNSLSSVHDRRSLHSLGRGRIDRPDGRGARAAVGLARLCRMAWKFDDCGCRAHSSGGCLVSLERVARCGSTPGGGAQG